jgi:hypothetical protein
MRFGHDALHVVTESPPWVGASPIWESKAKVEAYYTTHHYYLISKVVRALGSQVVLVSDTYPWDRV